jgi:16S rRNA (uracil1498-N3)-methyltransferase
MPSRATLLVGPEGGWTPEEVTAASALGPLVTLGKRTLRADAMALVALAALFARWREF